jgi:hypothetical protein
MHKRVVPTVVLLLSITTFAQAQEFKNAWSFQYGAGSLTKQDLVFSPFVHSSTTPLQIGLGYTRLATWHQNLNLRFAAFGTALVDAYPFTLDGEIQRSQPHNFTLIDVDYGLGRPINRTTSAGLQLAVDVQALTYSYGRVSGSFGYFANFGLGIYFEKRHSFAERHRISGKLSLPLLNWLARSPYLVNDDVFIENTSSHNGLKTFLSFIEDGNLVGLDKFQSIDLQLKYAYHLTPRWTLGANYLFEFVHSKQPRNLLQYRHSLHLLTAFNF